MNRVQNLNQVFGRSHSSFNSKRLLLAAMVALAKLLGPQAAQAAPYDVGNLRGSGVRSLEEILPGLNELPVIGDKLNKLQPSYTASISDIKNKLHLLYSGIHQRVNGGTISDDDVKTYLNKVKETIDEAYSKADNTLTTELLDTVAPGEATYDQYRDLVGNSSIPECEIIQGSPDLTMLYESELQSLDDEINKIFEAYKSETNNQVRVQILKDRPNTLADTYRHGLVRKDMAAALDGCAVRLKEKKTLSTAEKTAIRAESTAEEAKITAKKAEDTASRAEGTSIIATLLAASGFVKLFFGKALEWYQGNAEEKINALKSTLEAVKELLLCIDATSDNTTNKTGQSEKTAERTSTDHIIIDMKSDDQELSEKDSLPAQIDINVVLDILKKNNEILSKQNSEETIKKLNKMKSHLENRKKELTAEITRLERNQKKSNVIAWVCEKLNLG